MALKSTGDASRRLSTVRWALRRRRSVRFFGVASSGQSGEESTPRARVRARCQSFGPSGPVERWPCSHDDGSPGGVKSVRRSAEGFFGALWEPAARRDTSDAAMRSGGLEARPFGVGSRCPLGQAVARERDLEGAPSLKALRSLRARSSDSERPRGELGAGAPTAP